MKDKKDFSNIKDEKLRLMLENTDFEEITRKFFEKLEIEKKELEEYVNQGGFKNDLDKIKEYLKNHDFFCFDSNSYQHYIDFKNEKYLIKNIKSNVEEEKEYQQDQQEYSIQFDDLRFNFIHGLGTIIRVYKIEIIKMSHK